MDQYSPENNFGIAGKPLQPKADAQGHVYDSFQAANEKAAPLPKPDIQKDIKDLHNEKEIPTLRTYATDVEEAIKQKKTTVVNIAIAEKKKKEEKKPPVMEATNNIFILFTSIILIFGGLVALVLLGFFKFKSLQNIPTAPVQNQPKTIVQVESTIPVTLPPNETIAHALSVQKPPLTGKQNTLVNMIFNDGSTTENQALTADVFLDRLPSSAPSWFIRSVKPEFMVGYELLQTPQPFIILKSDSYETAFGGMLQWESTLQQDFSGLQYMGTSPQQAANSALTTSTTTNKFTDSVVHNINVRILKNPNGSTALVYALPDKQTIIITTNETVLNELFTRLTSSQFVR